MALVPLVGGQEELRSETFDGKLQSGAEGSKDTDTAVGESQRHEQFVPPPKGFLSPLASSPAFEDLGGFMEDHRRDRKIFGFTEEGPIPVRSLVEEVNPLRRERMTNIVEDGHKLVPTLQGQVNQFLVVKILEFIFIAFSGAACCGQSTSVWEKSCKIYFLTWSNVFCSSSDF